MLQVVYVRVKEPASTVAKHIPDATLSFEQMAAAVQDFDASDYERIK
jgi:hypothetical protein